MEWSEYSFVLKPSPIGGVGVFATHDIPAGTELFTQPFRLRTTKAKDIPQAFMGFCTFISDDECLCPERFDRLEIGWYINHSDTPNIAKKGGEDRADFVNDLKVRSLYAIKDIKTGDEIVIDYTYLGEPEHLKEDFYKKS